MIHAILIDLDDTLVAFDAVTRQSWEQVCQEYCGGKPDQNLALLLETIARHSEAYWSDPSRHRVGRNDLRATRREIVEQAFTEIGLPANQGHSLADRYSDVRTENMFVLPGARETLEQLRVRGIELCMVTNGESETQWQKIRRFDLARHFDHVLVEGDMGFGKPDDRVYALALSLLAVPPEQICMVGDNLEWDVGGPITAGMKGYWIDRKGEGLPPASRIHPDGILASFADLPAHLWSDEP